MLAVFSADALKLCLIIFIDLEYAGSDTEAERRVRDRLNTETVAHVDGFDIPHGGIAANFVYHGQHTAAAVNEALKLCGIEV